MFAGTYFIYLFSIFINLIQSSHLDRLDHLVDLDFEVRLFGQNHLAAIADPKLLVVLVVPDLLARPGFAPAKPLAVLVVLVGPNFLVLADSVLPSFLDLVGLVLAGLAAVPIVLLVDHPVGLAGLSILFAALLADPNYLVPLVDFDFLVGPNSLAVLVVLADPNYLVPLVDFDFLVGPNSLAGLVDLVALLAVL